MSDLNIYVHKFYDVTIDFDIALAVRIISRVYFVTNVKKVVRIGKK